MNDGEYIRKAVELVGWLESDEEGEYLQIPAQPFSAYLDEIRAPCEQYLLDALAAQLVRQVDALIGIDIDVHKGFSSITTDQGKYSTGHWVEIGEAQGEDRTMNTIKAIVDSKVLE